MSEGNAQEKDVSPIFDEHRDKKATCEPSFCDPENNEMPPPSTHVSSSEDEHTPGFDRAECRRSLALMIIKDGLPFNTVERQGFINLIAVIQPEFELPDRLAVARDCFRIYIDEKVKLREFFRTSGVHVCITVDKWTSLQGLDYMCITARYVDKDWNLHRTIIDFCTIESHKGEEMGRQIDGCLSEWGIAKVFAVTVDNASSNDDSCVDSLKESLTSRGCDVVKGKYLHMKCMTHVANLIVDEGLEVVKQSIERIREAVRYVRQSEERLEEFRECCEGHESIESENLLYLDVPNRWNTTYVMLSVALKFEKAFELFDVKDPSFKLELGDGVPTPTDWEIAKRITDVLLVFYELTLRISAPFHLTSNVAYHEIDTTGLLLREWTKSSNKDVKAIGDKMQLIYDKYWGNLEEMNKLIFVAIVVDPRYKLKFLQYAFADEYGDEKGSKMVVDLRLALDELYEAYKSQSDGPVQGQSDLPQSLRKKPTYMRRDKFKNYLLQSGEVAKKSDLEVYLQEDILLIVKEDFDILKWWKQHEDRFPVLSVLARDVLSMPISTAATDSTFSNGDNVLDDFRSSLTPKVVESLVCAQSWFSSSEEPKTVEEDMQSLLEDEFQSFQKLQAGSATFYLLLF